MKFMLMVQGKQSDYDAMSGGTGGEGPTWTEDDLQAMFAFMGAVNNDLAESGELVDAQGLAAPAQARLVTADKDGRPQVTEHVYGYDHPVMAGYWVIDVTGAERATEIAARIATCPVPEGSPDYPVVVHPIPEGPPSQD